MSIYDELKKLLGKYRELDTAGVYDTSTSHSLDVTTITIASTVSYLITKPFKVTFPFKNVYYVDGPSYSNAKISLYLGTDSNAEKVVNLDMYDSLELDTASKGAEIVYTGASYNDKPIKLVFTMNTKIKTASCTPRNYGSLSVGGDVSANIYKINYPGSPYQTGTTLTIASGTRAQLTPTDQVSSFYLSNNGPGALYVGGDNVGDSSMSDMGFLVPKGGNQYFAVTYAKLYGYASGGNCTYGGLWLNY